MIIIRVNRRNMATNSIIYNSDNSNDNKKILIVITSREVVCCDEGMQHFSGIEERNKHLI